MSCLYKKGYFQRKESPIIVLYVHVRCKNINVFTSKQLFVVENGEYLWNSCVDNHTSVAPTWIKGK